ncbi:MAG: hypothetical protein QOE60_2257 [Thermoleophilaceae bacterium]|nr:hypothetical protein [Thermoleophilaceae bacterium]
MHRPAVLAAGTVVFVIATGLAGCGSSSGGGTAAKAVDPNRAEVSPAGDIPDDQAFVTYAPPRGGYSMKVPEGWARTATGPSVTFTDKLNAIRMERHAAKAPLSVASAKRSALPALAKSVPGFVAGTVSEVQRAAGPAIRMTYLAQSKPEPVTGKARTDAVERYVFFHNGHDVVLTLSGPKGADNVDPWKIVTESLRFTR